MDVVVTAAADAVMDGYPARRRPTRRLRQSQFVRDAIRDSAPLIISELTIAGRVGHNYVIAAQRPEATHVAGYKAWQSLGRQVRKGETGIWILAPVTRRRDKEGEAAPASDAAVSTEARKEPARGEIVGVRGAAVFDVSQTEGDPLPVPPMPELLRGQAPVGLWSSLVTMVEAQGFSVDREELPGGVNGVTWIGKQRVSVRPDIDDAQAVKTLAHELGHVLLHTGDARDQAVIECRGGREVEAESIAHIVMTAHGVSADSYSFPYVAVWASRIDGYSADPGAAVRAVAGRVQSTARRILDGTLDTGEQETTAESRVLVNRAERTADAAAALAERAAKAPANSMTTGHAGRAADLNGLAAAFYVSERTAALGHFFDRRGVNLAKVGDFAIGQALVRPRLVGHLRGLGFSDDEIVAAGLARRRGEDDHLVDVFRGRITFGIRNESGQLAGFTARDYVASDGPKYLNTPAGHLFRKGNLLFGAAEQAEQLRAGTIAPVLVEGPMDVLALRQHNAAPPVVSTCGTAVTDEQVALLGRMTPARTIVIALDGDDAGQRAAEAAGARFYGAGWTVRVAAGREGDPAEWSQRLGAGVLETVEPRRCVDLPVFGVNRIVDYWLPKLDTAEGVFLGSKDVARYLATYPASPAIDQIARDTDAKLGTPQGTVGRALIEARQKAADAPGRLNDRAATLNEVAAAVPRESAAAARLGLSHHGSADRVSPARLPVTRPARVQSTLEGRER